MRRIFPAVPDDPPPPTARDPRSANKLRSGAPLLALAAICVIAGAFFFSQIGRGHLVHKDEFRTAERTREMLLCADPLTVHENFVPYFHKPPLYYWLSAPLLAHLPSREFALRFWSAVFALGTLAGTWWLARVVAPEHPWAAVAATALVCANKVFLVLGRLAMLDTGQTALVLATLAATIRARRDPRWWLGAAAFAGTAFLMKSPVAAGLFCASAVFFTLDRQSRAAVRSRYFLWGVVLLVVLAAWWPALETARFGREFVNVFFGNQMTRRFAETPANANARALFPEYARWFLQSWQWAAWPVLAACLAGWIARRFRENRGVILLALIAVAYGAALLRVRPAFERYMLLLIPLLAVLAAVALWTLTEKRFRPLAVCALAALVIFTGTRTETFRLHMSDGFDPRIEDQIPVAEEAGRTLRRGEHLVLLREGGIAAEARLYLFYGNLADTVYSGKRKEWEKTLQSAARFRVPVQGVMGENALPRLKEILPEARVLSQRGDLIHWAYEPAAR